MNKENSEQFEVAAIDAGKRFDLLLTEKNIDYSRSFVADQIKSGFITVNNKPVKPSYITKAGDIVSANFQSPQNDVEQIGEDIPLDIVFENSDVIVINKQPGLVVHPGCGNTTGTLVHALINHFPDIKEAISKIKSADSESRPGIVHRLDKDTSGTMIVAKNSRALTSLSKQIKNRTVQKKYIALCYGWPTSQTGRLVNSIARSTRNRKIMAETSEANGKEAITEYNILEYYYFKEAKVSLIEFNIKTGRTHQIRVQSSIKNIPVLGDLVYGNKHSIKLSKELGIGRILLHSKSLSINLPGDPKPSIFESPTPDDFLVIFAKLHKQE